MKQNSDFSCKVNVIFSTTSPVVNNTTGIAVIGTVTLKVLYYVWTVYINGQWHTSQTDPSTIANNVHTIWHHRMTQSVLVAMATTDADGGTANASRTALSYSLYLFAQPQPTSCFRALKMTGLDIQSGCLRLECVTPNESYWYEAWRTRWWSAPLPGGKWSKYDPEKSNM